MNGDSDGTRVPGLAEAFEPERLDGHTIEELGEYLDAGRSPHDASIEDSPGCRIALDALRRLRERSWEMLAAQAGRDAGREQGWIAAVLANISREARAGRDVPLGSGLPDTRLEVTEGAIRGLVRAAGDSAGGGLVGRVRLVGDVTVPGAPVRVEVAASAAWPEPLHPLAQRMRARILDQLARHSELNVTAVDVTIEDIHAGDEAEPGASR